MKYFIVGKHINSGKIIVSMIDSELRGLKLKENDCVLDFSSKFFSGIECSKDDALAILRNASQAIIAGKNAIEIAKNAKLVEEIKEIEKVPYAFIIEF